MERHREAMRFVPETTQQGNTKLIGLTFEGMTFSRQEDFLALLGQGTHVEIFMQIQLTQCLHHCGQLAFATVNHHHIRPVVEAIGLKGAAALVSQCAHINAFGFGAGPATKAAAHDFSHRHESSLWPARMLLLRILYLR